MASTLYTSGTVVTSDSLNAFDRAAYNTLAAVTGTDNLIATGPLSLTAYLTGVRFFFNPQNTNTTTVTININGIGNRAITKLGNTLLIAGDLIPGKIAEIVYDGVGFQLLNPQTFNLTQVVPITNGGTGVTTADAAPWQAGRLIGVQRFTANGTYTPTAGTTSVIVEAVGGGGGGGGCGTTGAGQSSTGAGGGAGGYVLTRLTSGFSGAAVTIGTAGGGGSGGTGGNGGATTLAALFSAGGGSGGTIIAGSASAGVTAGGLGGAASGGNLLNRPGDFAEVAFQIANGILGFGPRGASGIFGAGGQYTGGGANGVAGTGFGAGGGGTYNGPSTAITRVGGAGTAGLMLIYEYA